MDDPPAARDVGVVIPTYNRSDLLPDLVRALQAQTHPDFDVLIVDNGSTDETKGTLLRTVEGDGRFRVLRIDDNQGPARARNLGWRSTERPWIAFIDDDCVPEPDWLEELVAAGAEADIVQGRTIPTREKAHWFDRSQRIERWSGRFETCNLLFRRKLLEQLEGFDERYPVAMGEDTDLGLRALERGTTTTFADAALVRHHVWAGGFQGFLQHRRRYAEVVPLFRLQPAARALLHGGVVVRRVHLVVLGLVPVTIAALWVGQPWIPIVAASAWPVANTIRTRRRPHPWWRRLGYSTLQFAGYAYETWCFLVSSMRHRTLVL